MHSLPGLLEALKLLHAGGPLEGRDIASLSCSGGEAALMADAIGERRLRARPLAGAERERVGATLNDLVTVSNPLDYHTFIWGDADRLAATFAAMLGCGFDLGLLVIDPPRRDRCTDREWHVTFDAFEAALRRTGARGCLLATLPESFPEALAEDLLARGIAPLAGVEEGLAAVEAAADIGEAWAAEPARGRDRDGRTAPARGWRGPGNGPLRAGGEGASRASRHPGPARGARSEPGRGGGRGRARMGAPVAVKAVGRGLAHKSETWRGPARARRRRPRSRPRAAPCSRSANACSSNAWSATGSRN